KSNRWVTYCICRPIWTKDCSDSDGHSPLLLNKNESYANLQSFRNAVEGGKPGFTVETVNNNKMLIFYEPVKFRSTTWGVLLMQPYND
ncbi:MAG: hypothetical protein WA941_22285, partial [Nitrososphaeraceae archaeon]